jgi:hypothetical protein
MVTKIVKNHAERVVEYVLEVPKLMPSIVVMITNLPDFRPKAGSVISADPHKFIGTPNRNTQAKKSYRLSSNPCVEMMFTLAATAYVRSRQNRAQLNNGPKRPTSFSTEPLSAESWFCGPIDLQKVNPCPIIRGPDEQRCSWINTDQNLLATLCFLLIPLNGTNIRV